MDLENRPAQRVEALTDLEKQLLSQTDESPKDRLHHRETVSAVLEKIQYWTGGQKYLTDLLCSYVSTEGAAIAQHKDPTIVDNIVRQKILNNWQKSDAADHFSHIQKTLLAYESRGALLILYLQTLKRDSIASNDGPEQALLLQASLIQLKNNRLSLSNAIYPEIFDEAWIERQLPGITRPVSIIKGSSPLPVAPSHLPDKTGSTADHNARKNDAERVSPRRSQQARSGLISKPLIASFITVSGLIAATVLFLQLSGRDPKTAADRLTSSVAAESTTQANQNIVQLTLLGDTFSGYSTFRNADFQAVLQTSGLEINYDNEFDQTLRAQRLNEGGADLIVTTLDQFLQQAPQGKIVGLLDRTVGADAVVLNTKQYSDLKSLLDLNKLVQQAKSKGEKLSIVYAADTPSEYLALVLDTQFDTFNLSDFTLKPVADASEAWALMQNPTEQVAIAVLWEPYVAQARQQGYSVVLSSKDQPNVIVDVLVASNRLIQTNPSALSQLLERYYRRIDANIRDATQLQTQIAEDGNLSVDDAASVIRGIDFFTATEAKNWLSAGTLTQRIESTAAILTLSNRLQDIPSNPTDLYSEQFIVEAANNTQALIDLVEADNPELAAKLSGTSPTILPTKQSPTNTGAGADIGNLQVRGQVSFDKGSAQLTSEGIATLNQLASELQSFNEETTAIRIIGHTSRSGNADLNLELSQARATTVAQQLKSFGIRLNVLSEGKGFSEPLPNVPPEDPSNQRTEIRLVRIEQPAE